MTPLPSFTGIKRVEPLLTSEQRARLRKWRLRYRLIQNALKPSAFARWLGI